MAKKMSFEKKDKPFEKKDAASDKKAGIKENSKKDIKLDTKMMAAKSKGKQVAKAKPTIKKKK